MGNGGVTPRAPVRRDRKTALNRPEPITAPRAADAADGLPNPQRLMAFTTLRHGCRHGGARRDHRHRGAANHGASIRGRAGERDLDRQRLPARGHGFASAAGGARRHGGLPARLLVGACPFHRRLARLRARADICPAHLSSRRSGPGRGGNHERQHRAYPVHLSARAAWPRGRQSGGGGGDLLGRKPERRSGDPFGRLLALAVSDQRPDRGAGACHGGADPARDAARRRAPRSSERHSQRAHVRARHRRGQWNRPRRFAPVGVDRDRRRRRIRRGAGLAATQAPGALAAGRSCAGRCSRSRS